jgi:hypothetical protein
MGVCLLCVYLCRNSSHDFVEIFELKFFVSYFFVLKMALESYNKLEWFFSSEVFFEIVM